MWHSNRVVKNLRTGNSFPPILFRIAFSFFKLKYNSHTLKSTCTVYNLLCFSAVTKVGTVPSIYVTSTERTGTPIRTHLPLFLPPALATTKLLFVSTNRPFRMFPIKGIYSLWSLISDLSHLACF